MSKKKTAFLVIVAFIVGFLTQFFVKNLILTVVLVLSVAFLLSQIFGD